MTNEEKGTRILKAMRTLAEEYDAEEEAAEGKKAEAAKAKAKSVRQAAGVINADEGTAAKLHDLIVSGFVPEGYVPEGTVPAGYVPAQKAKTKAKA